MYIIYYKYLLFKRDLILHIDMEIFLFVLFRCKPCDLFKNP